MKKKVVVALSGGVDSAVTAHLMKEAGYDVYGVMLHLWRGDEDDHRQDIADAAAVAERLDIPFKVFSHQDLFDHQVVKPFVAAYLSGETPIPCAHCNREVKFPLMLQAADQLGIEYVATGHYVRLETKDTGVHLFKGIDLKKDQSYFLFRLNQEILKRIRCPLGVYTKDQIREIASHIGLIVADKRDSQDICFLKGNYYNFIEKHPDFKETLGDFVTTSGDLITPHKGISRYTVGQRKGLGIALGKPAYVVSIDPIRNRVVIGENSDLYQNKVTAKGINWVVDAYPVGTIVMAKIRYTQHAEEAEIIDIDEDQLTLKFKDPQRAVTPGQAMVLYRSDELIGGGIIVRD